ncbi:MAG: class 1 fructose-bisphosphatase [Myxococcales bacterium]|nr:class 1 fructose-bisphosphatase [Myxococcales bacterium]
MKKIVTINRHIMEQERTLSDKPSGDFSNLLTQMAFCAKLIGRYVNKAGLVDLLGKTGNVNVQGERVMKLDDLANQTILRAFDHPGYIAGMASEEEEDVVLIPPHRPRGKYILFFDPLDGSSNIDVNVSVGTIFSIYRKITSGPDAKMEDFLRRGVEQVAAGYVIYGSSTMMVYTTGAGVHGFTLDPEIGEFLLSHENITIPDSCAVLSCNETNYSNWSDTQRAFIDHIKFKREDRYAKTTGRYIGSLVSDFHRNMLYGGIFLYPEDARHPRGKLRLLYEANPMAMLAEQAGGAATDGRTRTLELQAKEIHQRTALVVGNRREVELYEKFYQGRHLT